MWATPKTGKKSADTDESQYAHTVSVYNRSVVSRHTGTSYTLPSKSPTTNLAYRNYVKDVERLRKELDRKDARNANIAQEMQQLRTAHSNQQRELRILSGTFEKCNNERLRFQADLLRTKEYTDKLELQLSRLGDSVALVQTVDKLQLTNEHYASELSNLKGVLAFKEEKFIKMEKELEAYERAMEIQRKFESEGGAAGCGDGGEAGLRSLYYELGKRQTDAHSLAISLAGTNKELKDAKDAMEKAQTAAKEMERQVTHAKNQASQFTHQANSDKEEISNLLEKNNNLKGLNTRFQGMVEDLSKRLREERDDFLKYKQEKDGNEQELLHTLENANKELHHLRLRVQNLDKAVKSSDTKRIKAEEILEHEIRKMNDERKVYAAKIKDGMHVSDQNKVLNMQLASAMKGGKNDTGWSPNSPAHALTAKLENQVKSLQADLEQAYNSEQELLHDREASVRALQQTIEATRELSAKFGDEKARRLDVEKRLASAEERADRAERDVAMFRGQTATASGSGEGNFGHPRGVTFVEENEIFAPPLPKPPTVEQPRHENQGNTTDSLVRPSSVKSKSPQKSEEAVDSPGRKARGVCKNFQHEGSCRFGDKCAFVHELSTVDPGVPASLRDSNNSVLSDTSAISTTSTAASSVADELARLRAELRQIEESKPK